QPKDYVIATGQQRSVREFIQLAAGQLGIELVFEGEGLDEVGRVVAVAGNRARCEVGDVVVKIDPRYFRPTEVETLLGDATLAQRDLGWSPRTNLEELVAEMVEADFKIALRDELVNTHGFKSFDHHE